MKMLSLPELCDVPAMSDADYPYREIGDRVRRLREHLGYRKLKDFADLNGWGHTQLTNWETGHRRITVEAATKLRERYAVSLDWVYLGIENALPQNLAKALSSRPADKS